MLTRKEAARYLLLKGCSIGVSSLQNMTKTRKDRGPGPAYYKDGRRIVYSTADLDEWCAKRLKRVVPA